MQMKGLRGEIDAVKEMGSGQGWRSQTLYSPVVDAGLLTLLWSPGLVSHRAGNGTRETSERQ